MTPREYFRDKISEILALYPVRRAGLQKQAERAQRLLEQEAEFKGQLETFTAFVQEMSALGIVERRKWTSAKDLHGLMEAIASYQFRTDE